MTSRTKGTVYTLTLTFPLCINPLNLIYHTCLLNDIKMMIFLLLSRLWWGTFSPPFRKIRNGSKSCLFTFARMVTMWAPCEGLPFRGQWGAAPSCKLPRAGYAGHHKVRDTTSAVTPLQWWALEMETLTTGTSSTLPGLRRSNPPCSEQRLQLWAYVT